MARTKRGHGNQKCVLLPSWRRCGEDTCFTQQYRIGGAETVVSRLHALSSPRPSRRRGVQPRPAPLTCLRVLVLPVRSLMYLAISSFRPATMTKCEMHFEISTHGHVEKRTQRDTLKISMMSERECASYSSRWQPTSPTLAPASLILRFCIDLLFFLLNIES